MDRPASRSALTIGAAPFDSPGVRWVTARAEDELVARYGFLAPGETELTASMFDPPGGVFLVATDADGHAGQPVGGVGVRPADSHPGEPVGEIKRLWVDPDRRANGLGRVLMDAAEREALALGYRALRLSTGPRQPEAIALYEASGWLRCSAEWDDGPIVCGAYHFSKELA